MSSWTFNLKPGDKVKVFGPFGEFFAKETKNEIKVILEKDYARNYLNLKFRHRYFVQLFLTNFSHEVSELKILILKDL